MVGDAGRRRVEEVEAETVHTQQRPGVCELHQVVEVVRVAGMPDDDLRQVGAFFAEHADDIATGLLGRGRVHRHGRARLEVGLGDRPEHPLDAG